MDSPFDSPRFEALTLEADGDRLDFKIDYDKLGEPRVSGEVTVRIRTPQAERIADHVRARIARPQAR